MSLRLFSAVFPSAEGVDRLREVMDELKSSFPKIRWVRPEAAHFTLAFLGESSDEEFKRAVSATARAGAPPFQLSFGDPGAFASWEKPRVVWIGLREGADSLAALAAAVRSAFEAEGLSFDSKPFVPHLTIARLSDGRPPKGLKEGLERAFLSVPFPSMRISRFDLVSSRLGAQFPEYSIVSSRTLEAA
jgi:2'-5' RNA ligase